MLAVSDIRIFTRQPKAVAAIASAPAPDLSRWQSISDTLTNPDGEVNIAIVGKYTGLTDAYKSLVEALIHGGVAQNVRAKFDWIGSWCRAPSASAARRA